MEPPSTDGSGTAGTRGDPSWIESLLAAQPAPSAPADVTAQVVAALAAEQRHREVAASLKADPITDLLGQSHPGTFGANPPRSYSPRGLGLHDHHTHH